MLLHSISLYRRPTRDCQISAYKHVHCNQANAHLYPNSVKMKMPVVRFISFFLYQWLFTIDSTKIIILALFHIGLQITFRVEHYTFSLIKYTYTFTWLNFPAHTTGRTFYCLNWKFCLKPMKVLACIYTTKTTRNGSRTVFRCIKLII